MKSENNKFDSKKFITRINKLTSHSKPTWGIMDVGQMLAHSQKPLELALGTLVAKPDRSIQLKCGAISRKKLMDVPEFTKNIPTFTEAKIEGKYNFESEKDKLIHLVEDFHTKGHAGLTSHDHPLLGKMSGLEWETLMIKHLDHHLKQFGV